MRVKLIMVSPALVLLVALCVARIDGQAFVYPACAAPNSTAVAPGVSVAPPPLPVLPTSFQVKVEANIIDRKFTNIAEEYYDGLNNRAAIRTFQNDTVDYMIFDYTNNQIIYDVNNNCYATDMVFDDNNLLFGMKTPNGIPHVYTTNGALHFAKANGLTYMGQSTVRGVTADHWQSCMYWSSLQSNFTLDYYFSAYNWTEGDLSMQVPLRAEIKGLQTTVTNYKFHHMYEYIDFRNQIWSDDTVFQTPRLTVCAGRKQTRAVPVLSGRYSYREEIVTTGDQTVAQADIWYDYPDKHVRFDYRPPGPAFPYFATNPVKEVHDYSTGIAYAIDKALGNCTIMPIQNTTFDARLNVSSSTRGQQFYIRMKSPSQMFYLDNSTYTFEGKRTVRGMLCDVFISKRTDFSLPGYTSFTSTFEFYFLDQSWLENNNIGVQSTQNSDIPIQLVISTPDWVGYQATYNIYNWDAEDPAASNFDITMCYSDGNKQSLIIEFPGQYDVPTLTPYKSALLTSTVNQITSVTHMSNIRVQNPQFNIGSDNAYFVATLLDLPPATAFFKTQTGLYNAAGGGTVITARGIDINMCATKCNNQSTTCNSFDFCPSTGVCTLYTTRVDKLSPSATCSHYSRSAASLPFELPLQTSVTQLKNEILTGNFKISVQINGATQSYYASTVDTNVIQNANRNLQTQSLMSQFTVQVNKGLKGYEDYIATGIAIDDCAKQCISKNEWVCNSFYYCFNTGYCVESKLHPDSRPSAVVNMELCDLYSRAYTSGFQEIVGKTVLSSSHAIYQNIYSADECAKLCTFYNGFNCKSFDYCDDISTCYLGQTHYYDVPSTDVQDSPMCNHYSRKYLADFKVSKRLQLTNTADRIISGVPVDQCAQLCVKEESFSCASFGYCGMAKDCRLSTASMKNVGQVSYTQSLTCDIYTRQTFPDGTPYINNPAKYYHIKTGSSGYSGGAMAGLAFAMLIIGAILVVAGYFGYNKIKRGPTDNMAVSFVKQEGE